MLWYRSYFRRIPILFVLFMAVWIVSMLISRSISKKRLKGFLEYIHENIKDFDPEIEEHLFAKQKSKQVRPDIMLFIIEENLPSIIDWFFPAWNGFVDRYAAAKLFGMRREAFDPLAIQFVKNLLVEGKIAGLMAARDLGLNHPNFDELEKQFKDQLKNLRQGPCGVKTRAGLEKAGETL